MAGTNKTTGKNANLADLMRIDLSLTGPPGDEVLGCAKERGVTLFATPLDFGHTEKMMGKEGGVSRPVTSVGCEAPGPDKSCPPT